MFSNLNQKIKFECCPIPQDLWNYILVGLSEVKGGDGAGAGAGALVGVNARQLMTLWSLGDGMI